MPVKTNTPVGFGATRVGPRKTVSALITAAVIALIAVAHPGGATNTSADSSSAHARVAAVHTS